MLGRKLKSRRSLLIFVAEVKVHEFASKMAAEPTREWSDEQLKSDDLPKKDIIKFIQDNAAHSVCLSPLSPGACSQIIGR